MAIKVIPSKIICTICGNEVPNVCDGQELTCQTCGEITCKERIFREYQEEHVESAENCHLYVRGLRQYWNCGPVIFYSKPIPHINCDDDGYSALLTANLRKALINDNN